MTRWILLGIGDDEVDVMSQVARDHPAAEVVVYHPDPEALVLALADVAEIGRSEGAPEPRADDVVVVGSAGKAAGLDLGWRKLGAKVIEPESLADPGRGGGNGAARRASPVASPPAMAKVPEERPASGAANGETVPVVAAEASTAVPSPPGPAPEVWADPQATFLWMLEQAGAREATLWWDGGIDAWTPWIPGTGSSVSSGQAATPAGHEIPCRRGRVVLSDAGAAAARMHPGMLSRLVEDLVLRDLEAWREQESRLRGLLPDSREADLLAWGRWLDAALPVLSPGAALLWMEHGDALRLARAWGEGVGLAGEFRLPKSIFETTFVTPTPWKPWALVPGLLLLFTMPPDRPAWPLALARLARIARGEASS